MRIVGVTSFEGPEALQVLEVPEPHPGSGEVRIKVHTATMNATDVGLRQGHQGHPLPERAEHPMCPAGIISEVAPGTGRQGLRARPGD
jgi:NADPH:quinone reductase-like Zn-dependent oxidoreductase